MSNTPKKVSIKSPITVYVVIGIRGEFSDRNEWVTGVYTDQFVAIKMAEENLREAKEAYVNWSNYWRDVYKNHEVTWQNKEFFEKNAPPFDKYSADDYTVVEIPLNTWTIAKSVKEPA
jgi:hypothetical protein